MTKQEKPTMIVTKKDYETGYLVYPGIPKKFVMVRRLPNGDYEVKNPAYKGGK